MNFSIVKKGRVKSFNWVQSYELKSGLLVRLYDSGLKAQCIIKENCIYSLVVNPKYRKLGYGKKCLKKAEQIISQKYNTAFLIPQDNDNNLRNYYSKLGYIGYTGNEVGYEAEDKAWWWMHKELTKKKK